MFLVQPAQIGLLTKVILIEEVSDSLIKEITNTYFRLFLELKNSLQERYND